MAGDLAAGGSANAIADDEGAEGGQRGAGVLIDVADAAGVGEHGEAVAGQGCAKVRGGWCLRLGELQSRGVWHVDTPGAAAMRQRCNDTPPGTGVSMVFALRVSLEGRVEEMD